MTPRKLLAVGATGQQGGAVIAKILADKNSDWKILYIWLDTQ